MELRRLILSLMLMSVSFPVISQSTAVEIRIEPLKVIRELADVEEPLELGTFIRTALVLSEVPEDQLADFDTIRTHMASETEVLSIGEGVV